MDLDCPNVKNCPWSLRAKGGKKKSKGKGNRCQVANGEGVSVDLTGNQEWTEPEAEAHVSSVLQQLNEIVEVVRRGLDSAGPRMSLL